MKSLFFRNFIIVVVVLLVMSALVYWVKSKQNIKTQTKTHTKTFTDPVTGMEFVYVKGGCFEMGDTFGDGKAAERPVHEVCVNDFYMGKYEVTVGQFKKFVNDTGYKTDAERGTGGIEGCYSMDLGDKEKLGYKEWANWKNPNKYQRNEDNHPVSCVSWNDANAFIEWLNRKSGQKYRLPYEAEWEYAARGGTRGRNYWGDSRDDACRYANVIDKTPLPNNMGIWDDNSHNCTDGYAFVAPIGKFQPNALGLYDMIGNVWEWCMDWYDKEYYSKSPKNNPTGPKSGDYRVVRGGSWLNYPDFLRVASRGSEKPDECAIALGFRLLRTP